MFEEIFLRKFSHTCTRRLGKSVWSSVFLTAENPPAGSLREGGTRGAACLAPKQLLGPRVPASLPWPPASVTPICASAQLFDGATTVSNQLSLMFPLVCVLWPEGPGGRERPCPQSSSRLEQVLGNRGRTAKLVECYLRDPEPDRACD